MSKKETNLQFEEVTHAHSSGIETSGLEKMQAFYEKNKNQVHIGLGIIVLLIAAILFYKTMYLPKKEKQANDAMFNAQYYFEQDSFDLALNGPGGFLEIADDFGGTKAAKLANYYAGICYFNLGNYPDAISHLKKFSTSDPVLGSLSIGVLADAQMENGDTNAALGNYKKAANFSDNEAVAPFLLKKAGIAYEMNGDAKQANAFFTKIKEEFPNSDIAKTIDIYIGRTSVK